MSDRYDRGPPARRRGAMSHWVPLVLTLTIATAGVAAWAWSQRNRDEDYEDEEGEHGGFASGSGGGPGRPSRPNQQQQPYTDHLDYDHADYGDNPPYGVSTPQPPGSAGDNAINMTESAPLVGGPNAPPPGGWGARMSGALGGNASPQQWVGNASKAVSAGITAASAAVGGALASIREGDRDAYADHETWSEEADARNDRPTRATAAASAGVISSAPYNKDAAGRKRKTVAIVVSADHYVDVDEDGFHEHAVCIPGGGAFVALNELLSFDNPPY